MAPNFRFSALFAISDDKQRVWYITRGIYPAFLENRIFFTPFSSIASFHKKGYRAKRSGQIKKDELFGFGMIKFMYYNVVLYFLGSKVNFTAKLIFLKKVTKLLWFFYFEVRYLRNRWSDFDDFFLQTALNIIFFSYQKRKGF